MSTRRGSVAASVPRERTPNGMIARKIIVVPCMVNSPLKVSAVTTAFAGLASCSRIRSASMPPTRKNAKADVPYRMPIRLWSTVVSHAHTSLPTCGPARGSASSGVAMLGWPPPSCRRCPLVPGGRSPSGAPEGQESHSRPPLARDCHAPRCAGRTADRWIERSSARLRRGLHGPVFVAQGGEDDAHAYGGQAPPKEDSIASQGDVSGLLRERLDQEPTDLLVERPSEPDK